MFNTSLKDETHNKYLQMANSFLIKHDLDIVNNGERLCTILASISSDYRPAYWRNLRNAISYYLFTENHRNLAEKVRQLSNPVTLENGDVKPKQQRCKKVTEQDMQMLMVEAMQQKNRTLVAAIYIANLTGCRPCEMPTISHVSDNTFLIVGGKKRSDRGLDRMLKINDRATAELFGKMLKIISGKEMKPIQNAFDRSSKKTFRKRKVTPSLYSFRHQMGSDLKASGIDRKTVAYLMGHRATQSVNVYGNRRTAGGRSIKIVPGINDDEINKLVKENHQIGVINSSENNKLY
ncbi:hypothetical protein LCGC14_0700460 [marine sediment metagenome]|uniref:Tyr recombinase domain-containing protein n=1 Tax=marine sediment metagenome TaxID=412755 RepID=A0A0F9QHX1_9ZZZZ|nr:site-specific integrase [Methylophaga sp.]HEC58929.1 site-specific integrase [Methylophaga sp.]